MHFNWSAKIWTKGAQASWSSILILLLITVLLLHAKMLKETETEKTVRFIVIIFIISGILNGEKAPALSPFGYAFELYVL